MLSYFSVTPHREETVQQYVTRQLDIRKHLHEIHNKTPYILTEAAKTEIQQSVVKYFSRPSIVDSEDLKAFAKDLLDGKYAASSPFVRLADDIETFMFLRGEYDEKDKIRWIAPVFERDKWILEVGALTYERVASERACVRYLIGQVLDGTAPQELGGIKPLMDYFSDQKAEMLDDNEMLFSAGRIYQQLCDLVSASMGRS
jgi:hypothetical protein